MAEDNIQLGSTFEWNLYDPFLPEQKFEAKFWYGPGSPNIQPWKATLESMDRRTNYWAFMVCLEFLEGFERRCEIVADTLKVCVDLNGKRIAEEQDCKVLFCISNRFKYFKEGIAPISPQKESHHLLIRIEMSLLGRDAKYDEGLFPKDLSLRTLSTDLISLLKDKKHADMTLWSTNPRLELPVHSCILEARWNNFSKKHPFARENWNNLETNISAPLLLDILAFLYSGTCGVNWPYWKEASYASELFQVIDFYGMSHLRKTFFNNELRHERLTKNPVVIDSRVFELGKVGGCSFSKASYTWDVDFRPECEIVFRVQVGHEAGNWLSYSLQSKSESQVHVEVNFRLEKRLEGKDPEDLHFHEQHYSIDPKQSVEPRFALFLGCPETFGNFLSTPGEANFFVHCSLKLTDGTTVEQVTNVGGDRMRLASELLFVLGNDMRKVRKRKFKSDMQILSSPGFFDGVVCSESIHKAIFAARVPQWWAMLENTTREEGVPETVTSNLSIDSLPYVLDYIYTGKSNVISNICHPFVQEVEDFAAKTMFLSLHELAISFPSDQFYKKGA